VGSWSFFAKAFRSFLYALLMFSDSVGKSLLSWFMHFLVMYFFNISSVFAFTFSALPTQCFADVMFTIPFSRFMSLTRSHVNSIGLVPRSLLIERNSAMRVLALDMSMLIFSSEGIFGSLS